MVVVVRGGPVAYMARAHINHVIREDGAYLWAAERESSSKDLKTSEDKIKKRGIGQDLGQTEGPSQG